MLAHKLARHAGTCRVQLTIEVTKRYHIARLGCL